MRLGDDECVVVEDDAELAARAGAQADLGGGHSLAGPHRGRFGFVASANSAAQSQLVVLHELAHAVFEIVRPVARVVIRERLFERGAGNVGIEDERIRRIDHRRLGRPAEELAGVRHEPLVELIFARNEHGDARPQGAPGLVGFMDGLLSRDALPAQDRRLPTFCRLLRMPRKPRAS